MSLINDALKKAQKQRTDGTPPLSAMPSIGGEPANRIAKRSKPVGFNSLLMWIGGGCVAIAIFLLGGYLLIRKPSNPPETAPLAKAAVVAAKPPATNPAEPAATTPVAANAPAAYVLPNAPGSVSATPATPSPAKAVEIKPVVAAPVAPEPEPEVPKVAVPAPKLPAAKITYIEAQRVAGIRASATDSKVLMNDRVYRLGDIVEHNLGLKLVGITLTSLTFEDESGARYTRNF